MSEKINIVYIDDSPDTYLERYLRGYGLEPSVEIDFSYSFIHFGSGSNQTYEDLLKNDLVKNANIIFIDSRLFEVRTAQGKFSGEEFKLILKKVFPYIETIVISQKPIEDGYQTIKKYDLEDGIDYPEDISRLAKEFYTSKLSSLMEQLVEDILEYRKILHRVNENELDYNQILIDKVKNSINGLETYEELKREDIEEIIQIFQQFESTMGNS